MRIALVHDYLNQFGGAERVLAAIAELYPEAPVFTAVYDSGRFEVQNSRFKGQIKTPPISRIPFISHFYKHFSFLYPLVFEGFDLSEYDVIISSSSNFAKGVITRPGQIHICYCHTPPRFLYHYETEGNFRKHWFWGRILPPLDNYLRIWDWCAAQRVDYFVANSQTTAARIKKFYGREAKVVYPPVDLVKAEYGKQKTDARGQKVEDGTYITKDTFRLPSSVFENLPSVFRFPPSYFLTVSRLSRYKNIDIMIKACNELKLNLVVVGDGPERKNLEKIAGKTVKLVGRVSDEVLAGYYQNCQAVICAASDEDFGITPVEAMSFGKPVIALRAGGFKETVVEGKTGEFFSEPTVASLKNVLANFDANRYLPQDCIAQAQKFSKERFQREFRDLVDTIWYKDG